MPGIPNILVPVTLIPTYIQTVFKCLEKDGLHGARIALYNEMLTFKEFAMTFH